MHAKLLVNEKAVFFVAKPDKRPIVHQCCSLIEFLLSQVQLSRGEQYAQQVNALFCETSALDATNVEELFIQISECPAYKSAYQNNTDQCRIAKLLNLLSPRQQRVFN